MTVTTDPDEAASNQTDNQAEHRRTNFTRSQSIEKIIKFNAYICSQNFFILHSILTWLKTSQTILKTYVIPAKSTVLYYTIDAYRIVSTIFKDVTLAEPQKIVPALKTLFSELSRTLDNLPEEFKRKILKTTVYFCLFYIFFQLSLCVWALSGKIVPWGLFFLVGCLMVISYANFQCLRFVIIKEILKAEAKYGNVEINKRKYVKPRHILGKRTISNVNLF